MLQSDCMQSFSFRLLSCEPEGVVTRFRTVASRVKLMCPMLGHAAQLQSRGRVILGCKLAVFDQEGSASLNAHKCSYAQGTWTVASSQTFNIPIAAKLQTSAEG